MNVTRGDNGELPVWRVRLTGVAASPACNGAVGSQSAGVDAAGRDGDELAAGDIGLTVREASPALDCAVGSQPTREVAASGDNPAAVEGWVERARRGAICLGLDGFGFRLRLGLDGFGFRLRLGLDGFGFRLSRQGSEPARGRGRAPADDGAVAAPGAGMVLACGDGDVSPAGWVALAVGVVAPACDGLVAA